MRAYKAHECKAKGFRAFLHSSAQLPEDDEKAWLLPRLEPEEESDCVRELNFMYRGENGSTHDWLYLQRTLEVMRTEVDNEKALRHYDASARILERFERLLVDKFGEDKIIRLR